MQILTQSNVNILPTPNAIKCQYITMIFFQNSEYFTISVL